MTKQDDGTPAIEGQKPIGEQNALRRERLRCPACGFKIYDEQDHEPNCANSDWDRQDVIDHIMKKSKKHARTVDFPTDERY